MTHASAAGWWRRVQVWPTVSLCCGADVAWGSLSTRQAHTHTAPAAWSRCSLGSSRGGPPCAAAPGAPHGTGPAWPRTLPAGACGPAPSRPVPRPPWAGRCTAPAQPRIVLSLPVAQGPTGSSSQGRKGVQSLLNPAHTSASLSLRDQHVRPPKAEKVCRACSIPHTPQPALPLREQASVRPWQEGVWHLLNPPCVPDCLADWPGHQEPSPGRRVVHSPSCVSSWGQGEEGHCCSRHARTAPNIRALVTGPVACGVQRLVPGVLTVCTPPAPEPASPGEAGMGSRAGLAGICHMPAVSGAGGIDAGVGCRSATKVHMHHTSASLERR